MNRLIITLLCCIVISHIANGAETFKLACRNKSHNIHVLVFYQKTSCCSLSTENQPHDFGPAASWREKQIALKLQTGHELYKLTALVKMTPFKNVEYTFKSGELEQLASARAEVAIEQTDDKTMCKIVVQPKRLPTHRPSIDDNEKN